MKLAVIGSGYVGLVAGACFAETGNHVICMDNNAEKIEKLKKGIIPIYEPGLERMVLKNVDHGRLLFTTDMQDTVDQSDIIFIAVGTPPDEDGSADLRHVLAVAKDIGRHMKTPKIVVNKSTVPVGTAKKVLDAIKKETSVEVDVVSNPEFLKEGAAIDDFMYPDRVIVGTSNPKVGEIMQELYSPFVRTGNPIMIMDEVSAELTKYAANSILATKISFMNEMANLCDPKDVKALIRTAQDYDFDMRVLKAVEDVNEDQKRYLLPKILSHYKDNLKGKTFSIWGLSFKPKTDDMREAPSRVIIKELFERGAKIKVHDPVALDEAKRLEIDKMATLFEDNYDTLKDSDGLILVTEWLEYRELDFEKIKSLMKEPVIFDGRNIFKPEKLKSMGFTYYGVGRK
ncbi:MAG: UDP-glucose/GDP-mannose dehydrogenase family protein [Calditrichia bacterium]